MKVKEAEARLKYSMPFFWLTIILVAILMTLEACDWMRDFQNDNLFKAYSQEEFDWATRRFNFQDDPSQPYPPYGPIFVDRKAFPRLESVDGDSKEIEALVDAFAFVSANTTRTFYPAVDGYPREMDNSIRIQFYSGSPPETSEDLNFVSFFEGCEAGRQKILNFRAPKKTVGFVNTDLTKQQMRQCFEIQILYGLGILITSEDKEKIFSTSYNIDTKKYYEMLSHIYIKID